MLQLVWRSLLHSFSGRRSEWALQGGSMEVCADTAGVPAQRQCVGIKWNLSCEYGALFRHDVMSNACSRKDT
jgi:hypothetical protein